MTDIEFLHQAEALLKAVELHCDRINDESDVDVDNQRVGSMITITFTNKSQIIINLQKPIQEVWLAARSGGYHYRFDGHAWMNTKGGADFWSQLTQDASVQSGNTINFAAAL